VTSHTRFPSSNVGLQRRRLHSFRGSMLPCQMLREIRRLGGERSWTTGARPATTLPLRSLLATRCAYSMIRT
jgi:hypothetical protein